MKEATGELNMTVITVVAIAGIAALFVVFILPGLKVSLANRQCEADCGAGNFTRATRDDIDTFECKCTATTPTTPTTPTG